MPRAPLRVVRAACEVVAKEATAGGFTVVDGGVA